MIKKLMFATFLTTFSCLALADTESFPEDFGSFIGAAGSLPTPAASTRPQRLVRPNIIPYIKNTIKQAASYNISAAEQVLCYHVAKPPKLKSAYTGYTINGLAITDYCGTLDLSTINTTYEALFTQSANIITIKAQCFMEPKVMLRFVRGVDYTDVLLSSPCPSFGVYYGGNFNAFNIKQGIIDSVIAQFEKTHHEFHSPALLNQTAATAIPNSEQEEYKLEKKARENAPVMNWKKAPSQAPATAPASASPSSSEEAPTTGGWNKFKLRK